MTEIRLENIKYEKDALYSIYKYHYQKAYGSKNVFSWYLASAIFFLLISYVYVTNAIKDKASIEFGGIFFIAYSLFCFIMHFTISKRFVYKMVKSQLREEKPATYITDAEGLREIDMNHNSFYKWNIYVEYLLREDVMLLYEKDGSLRMFARKYYSENEWKQLITWVSAKVPASVNRTNNK